jgi:hypothetical protein
MKKKDVLKFLEDSEACIPGFLWCKESEAMTSQDLWEKCVIESWALWILDKIIDQHPESLHRGRLCDLLEMHPCLYTIDDIKELWPNIDLLLGIRGNRRCKRCKNYEPRKSPLVNDGWCPVLREPVYATMWCSLFKQGRKSVEKRIDKKLAEWRNK